MDGLPILATAAEAVSEIRNNWRSLVKALIVPAIAISTVETVQLRFSDGLLYSLLFWSLSAPFYVLFATVCHRIVILGSASLPSVLGVFWTERETRFFGWTIALILVSWGFGLVVGLVALLMPISLFGLQTPWLPFALIGLITAYFYLRLSMVFPATAVDQRTSIEDTWYLTAGHGFRIMGAIGLPAIAVAVVFSTILYLFSDPNSVPYVLITEVFGHTLFMTVVCTISVAYRSLSGLESIEETA